jgi:hypothetical protein
MIPVLPRDVKASPTDLVTTRWLIIDDTEGLEEVGAN